MNKSVKISVIMSVFNPASLENLQLAVDSILSQSLTDFEFLILDDGSGPKTRRALENLAGKDERIRLIFQKENRGLAAGLNACIRQARGEYIARMDDDDISLPDRLAVQAEFLDSHPEYGFVGCTAQILDEGRIRGRRDVPRRPGKKDFLPHSPYIHPSVMFRKSVFEKFGGYCESRHMRRCEDYEIFMRLHGMGCYGYNLQKELFCYREERASFKKRKLRYRLDELRLRRKGFAMLGLAGPGVWLQILRPLAGALVPASLLYLVKRKAIHCRRDTSWSEWRLSEIQPKRYWLP